MIKALVAYYSKSGNTKTMAQYISNALELKGLNVIKKDVNSLKADELKNFEVIIIGSPTYYGLMSQEIKRLLDESVILHGQLKGKIGGAFSSSANIGGGNETAILSILNAFLIHGMVITGNPSGDHYGPVSIGNPDGRVKEQCREYAEIIAELAKKIFKS